MLIHVTSNASPAVAFKLIGQTVHPPAWYGLVIYGLVTLLVIAATRGRLSYHPETFPPELR